MRGLPVLLLLGAVLGGCSTSPCERLTDELCATRGDDDALCQARRTGSDEQTRLGDLQCKRALFLYQAERGGGAR
ncbi:MAG: hypothetical protein ABIK09_16545 [Pseudomonadota bacterium]